MIYESGHHAPTRQQIAHVRDQADESFCQTPSGTFDFNIPCPAGFSFDRSTVTLLTLKNVEPHDDPWVGATPHWQRGSEEPPPGWTYDGPVERRAMFWVVDLPKFHDMFLQVGLVAKRMRAGDWVMFDDRILHCVLSSRKWYGCAYQLMPSDEQRVLDSIEEREMMR
jgi:hypothetical protein